MADEAKRLIKDLRHHVKRDSETKACWNYINGTVNLMQDAADHIEAQQAENDRKQGEIDRLTAKVERVKAERDAAYGFIGSKHCDSYEYNGRPCIGDCGPWCGGFPEELSLDPSDNKVTPLPDKHTDRETYGAPFDEPIGGVTDG